MIRTIAANLVAIGALAAAFFVGAKSEENKWSDLATYIIELAIFTVGSGLFLLIASHNQITELLVSFVSFVKLCRQHLWVTCGSATLYVVVFLSRDLLFRIFPRFKHWAEGDLSAGD